MARRVYREHSLQIAVAHMLDVVLDPERTWWTAIDHGVGKLGSKEAGIRKARGVKRGIPDIVILMERTHPISLVGIELKAGRGQSSDAQDAVMQAWGNLDWPIYIARSLEEVQDILTACCVPLRTRMNFFSKGANDERVVRPTPPRHRRARRSRKSKGYLPVVLG